MRSLHYYMLGTGTWFMGYGIQGVMFAWLVTMVLRESPEMVGLAQMTLLLPGMLLILVGGSYSDRYGGRRIAMAAQAVGALAPLLLLALLWFDRLSFSTMLVYAVLMGCAQAFVTPARDGLLNQVAAGRVQRTVMLTSMVQFGVQMFGFFIASLADTAGPLVILATQSLILTIGVFGFRRIPQVRISRPVNHALLQSVIEGARTVLSSTSMRMVVLQNVAMGMFFMGSYIVTMPLLVREVYDGSAQDLAFMNGANSFGLVLTILFLLRIGDVRRLGRALILSQGLGSVVLGCAALVQGFSVFVLALFFWGVCGGLAMTMSRTIMQEQAPDEQRGRVMSFYSFSFMGSGPIGALLSGYLVEQVGPQTALLISAGMMLAIMVITGFRSSLWKLGELSDAPPETVG